MHHPNPENIRHCLTRLQQIETEFEAELHRKDQEVAEKNRLNSACNIQHRDSSVKLTGALNHLCDESRPPVLDVSEQERRDPILKPVLRECLNALDLRSQILDLISDRRSLENEYDAARKTETTAKFLGVICVGLILAGCTLFFFTKVAFAFICLATAWLFWHALKSNAQKL
jgi:hypothetical protein